MLRVWAVLSLLAWSGGAWAETLKVPLVQAAEPIRHVYPGLTLRVGGIELGMTADEVRRKLAGPGVQLFEMEEFRPLTYRERDWTAIAVPSLYEVSAGWPAGLTNVRFALPTTGGRVIAVSHLAKFDQSKPLPTVRELLDQLILAYGPVSENNRMATFSQVQVSWVYDEAGPHECGPRECAAPPPVLDARAMEDSRRLLGKGRQLRLLASFSSDEPWAGDDSGAWRAETMFITIYDDANVVLTVEKGVEQLRAAIAAKLATPSSGMHR